MRTTEFSLNERKAKYILAVLNTQKLIIESRFNSVMLPPSAQEAVALSIDLQLVDDLIYDFERAIG